MYQAGRLKQPHLLPVLLAMTMLAASEVAVAASSGANLVFDYPNGFAGAQSAINVVPSAAFSGTSINLTAASHAHQAGAAWYKTQVNVQSFTTDFTFQMPSGEAVPSIVGITFCIQNSNTTTNPGPNGYGSSISLDANTAGYGAYWYPSPGTWQYPIGKSIAIKFDMNSANGNTATFPAGGSPNSTGLYINGGPSAGLVPQDDLNPSGIDLYGGHIMAAQVVYDGSLLTLTLRDTVTNAQFRTSWPINIPAIVGGNTAWVGFTAGEIPAGSNRVLTWNYSTGYNTRLATPTFSVSPGAYTSAQTVTISAPPGATIYYTTNGRQPTTSSNQYTGPVTVSANTFLQAVAVQSGYTDSLVATANYQIQPAGLPAINFPSGFAGAANLMSLVGIATVNNGQLQLTNSVKAPASQQFVGNAWYVAPVSILSFTTDFTIQVQAGQNYAGTGMTFCIQNLPLASDYTYDNAPPSSTDKVLRWAAGGPNMMGNGGLGSEEGFGYSGGTGSGTYNQTTGPNRSIAIKFDSDKGGTGLYSGGESVTANTVSMGAINLTSGHPLAVSLSYNGATLSMTVTDTTTNAKFSTSWTVNIPAVIGANNAYVGFTAGSYYSVVQQVTAWTWSGPGQTTGQPPPPPPLVPMPPTDFTVH